MVEARIRMAEALDSLPADRVVELVHIILEVRLALDLLGDRIYIR